LNILLGPDETSIQDSSVDDHYSYRVIGAGGGGGARPYNETALAEPPGPDRGRSLPGLHGASSTSFCRLGGRADAGGVYTDCAGRLSCVEMRSCGCDGK